MPRPEGGSRSIVLTGGGTAGHVTPNIALLPGLKKAGYNIFYIGSHDGIERKLIEALDIPYYHISTGKLRRYLSLRNLTDPFRVVKGFFDARRILKELKPSVIFSKGGFVSVPVVWAAFTLGIPSIIHESDMTPGLANKLSIPFAKHVCCNFPETLKNLPHKKAVLTGSPLREQLLKGSREKGLELCRFENPDKPIILAMGGSLGAAAINKALREALPVLLERFNVIHLCGKDKLDNVLLNTPGYRQYEYVDEAMGDVLAAADIIVSRAGANAICEFQALKKPALLIPLSSKSSRGDQIKNAASFEKQGFSLTLSEDDLSKLSLVSKIDALYKDKDKFIYNMSQSRQEDSVGIILSLIKKLT